MPRPAPMKSQCDCGVESPPRLRGLHRSRIRRSAAGDGQRHRDEFEHSHLRSDSARADGLAVPSRLPWRTAGRMRGRLWRAKLLIGRPGSYDSRAFKNRWVAPGTQRRDLGRPGRHVRASDRPSRGRWSRPRCAAPGHPESSARAAVFRSSTAALRSPEGPAHAPVTPVRGVRRSLPLRRRWDLRGRELVPTAPAPVTPRGRTASH
jgi:hypothetical protein